MGKKSGIRRKKSRAKGIAQKFNRKVRKKNQKIDDAQRKRLELPAIISWTMDGE